MAIRRSRIYPDTFIGPEVDLEAELTDDVKPTTQDPTSVGVEVEGSGTVSKTTSIKKTTTIKKTTVKTSSESSSGSTSSSSSGHSSSSSGHSSSSQSGFDGYDGTEEGSGYGDHSSRVHGRTHSRVSRRVYSSSDGSRFGENDFGGETNKEDEDGDGRVISHYDRTHHSSGKSPDGKSTFQETRHESRKVTVSKNTNTDTDGDNVPSSRWGQGGGYRRTYSENRSSSRTNDGEPEETHTHWETHQTYPTGQDGENRWGDSGSSDTHGRREESRIEHSSRTHTVDSSTRKTHSSQLGEDNYRRTHEGGAITRPVGGEGSYWTDGDRRTRTRDQDNTDNRERFVWSDNNRGTEGTNREGNYYEDGAHNTGDHGAGGRRGSSSHSGSGGDGYESRVDSSRQQSSTRYEGRSSTNQGLENDRLSGTHHSRGSEGGYDDRYSSSQGYRNHQDRYDDRRTYSNNEDRTTYSTNYDRTRGRDDYRRQQSEDITRRQEDDDWQHRQYRRPEHTDTGREETYRGNNGDSARQGSRSESRTSTWQSYSSSRDGGRDRSHHQDLDDNYERHQGGGNSERRFTHTNSDGSVANGTYTRVEVDPQTGKTTTYSRKVTYKNWPTDSDHQWASEDSTFLPGDEQVLSSHQRSPRTKREKELIIKPQAVTDEKTGKTMQVVHLVSNISHVVLGSGMYARCVD